MRGRVHGRSAGRGGREEVRRDGGQHDRPAALRQRGSLESDCEGLEENLGIPLPVATQCEIVAETAVSLQPALEELKRQAAQGEVVHNDDTSMRVLSLDRDADILAAERTGVFTSGLVWIVQERRIALYFTGCKHAGENLAEVLKQRSADLPPPIQMCDALSRNRAESRWRRWWPTVMRTAGGIL